MTSSLATEKTHGARIRRTDGETRDEFIARLVDAAPPLTEAQRARLRPVLAPVRAVALVRAA
ncbi:hypothetical protein [Amycolatopsis sp. NPDC051128]|uniref:hypothetical protein n=1 Tax=Amycolatopsis sp. NPDC051128 TaxID=3155412 RepID=UPI003435BD9A